MPPGTPSPRRFLPSHRRQSSPSKETARPAPSALRISTPAKSGDGFDATDLKARIKAVPSASKPALYPGDGFQHVTPMSRPSAQQFVQTPRFSLAPSAQTPHLKPRSPERSTLARPLWTSTRLLEDVEEAPARKDEDDEMLELEPVDALPTNEGTPAWMADLSFSPKRRRLENSAAPGSSAKTIFKQPTTTSASLLHQGAHPFTRAPSVASSVAYEGATIRRPAFLRLSLAPSEQPAEPRPETFSPHRRGEKFIPGGMAATLQQWIVETGHGAAQARKAQAYLRSEDYMLRIKVGSVSGTRPQLVSGTLPDGREMHVLFVVDGKKPGTDVVSVGGTLVLRPPLWTVSLGGITWTVSVDGNVLQ